MTPPDRSSPLRAEADRLAALHRLRLMDTAPSPDFDAVVALAARHFDCPLAMLILVDRDRQWAKATYGVPGWDSPREHSVCHWTIQGEDVLAIEDLQRDPRFHNLPAVTGSPGLRFYAGLPLPVEGSNIGTLCLLDRQPRRFGEAERDALRQFGLLAQGLLLAQSQARRAEAAAQETRSLAALSARKTRLLQQTERLAQLGGWELSRQGDGPLWSDEVFRIHELPFGHPVTITGALLHYPPGDRERVAAAIEAIFAEGRTAELEADFVTATGRLRRIRLSGEPERDQQGQVVRAVGLIQDITEAWQLRQRLQLLAMQDPLTGLANRAQLLQRLEAALQQTLPGGALALLLLDLDNFQDLNDRHGHLQGDALLRGIAGKLLASAGGQGMAARTGSDEFALLLPVTDEAGARQRAELVGEALRQPLLLEGVPVGVSASIGVALGPRDGDTGEMLMRQADIALSHGRRLGRGRVTLFSPEIAQRFLARREAIELVRLALHEGWVRPFYQPKLRMADGRRCGFEALVRILPPDGRVLGPGQFWAALQEEETARLLGQHMLRAVCADLRRWREAGLAPVRAGLNVSEADFIGGGLAQNVMAQLALLDLPPSALTIEVTETVLLSEAAPAVIGALSRLHAGGIAISLDDFGTGHASLAHLRDFPIQELKIDQSFVARLEEDARNGRIIGSIVELAHGLGLRVVAEGVETAAQHAALQRLGCDEGQGFLYGRPMPAARAEAWLRGEAAAP